MIFFLIDWKTNNFDYELYTHKCLKSRKKMIEIFECLTPCKKTWKQCKISWPTSAVLWLTQKEVLYFKDKGYNTGKPLFLLVSAMKTSGTTADNHCFCYIHTCILWFNSVVICNNMLNAIWIIKIIISTF